MKRLKSAVSVILTIVLIVSMAAISIPSANAATLFRDDNNVVYSIISNWEAHVYGYEGTEPVVTIPNKIGARVITAVDDKAFYKNETVQEIYLPESVEKIGMMAFMYAVNLEYVDIPVSVGSIGTFAFAGCTSLNEIDLTSVITEITASMFQQSGITHFETPYNVSTIASRAFQNCNNLESVTINNSVKTINEKAFLNCTSLTSVIIPETTTSIDASAFTNCPNLTIVGYFDSYAEEYALANDIPFEPIVNYALGDVDKDGDVTIYDVTLIQKALAGIYSFGKEEDYLADVKRDGSVSIDDATAIQKFLADLIPAFE